jgi:hypothetical protein
MEGKVMSVGDDSIKLLPTKARKSELIRFYIQLVANRHSFSSI